MFAGTAGVELPEIDLPRLGDQSRDALEDLGLSILDNAGLASPDMHEDMRTRMRLFAANIREYAVQQPREYGGRLLLINAIDNDPSDDLAHWKQLSPGLEHRTVPGEHFTMLRPPHLVALAATVREALALTWERR